MSAAFNHTINPNVSVDNVILGFDGSDMKVLLIERTPDEKIEDFLALPGDLIYEDEGLDDAAARVLYELTGLKNIFLEQFFTFGSPNRISKKEDLDWLKKIRAHPEARVITVAYYSLVKIEDYKPTPSGFASNAIWVPIHKVPQLAFDHNEIFDKAIEFLKRKIYHEPVGFELLPEKFTLAQLQRLYEIILHTRMDKRNFRRKILKAQFVVPLQEKQTGVAHKPAMLYKFDKKKFDSVDLDFPAF
ncbi:MAG: NUDIX domain-containing protein [Bacteroidetes bacterium]|nr:NUDIX domain-containing protein [Bacteroidota bacterium]